MNLKQGKIDAFDQLQAMRKLSGRTGRQSGKIFTGQSMNIENTTEVKKRAQVQISSFTGPLPPPEILKSYDSIVDGAASRIIKMAEIQADHRRALEWKSREYE